jgi:hypothetical protein
MSIYQVKLKGEDDKERYDTFRATSVEDVLKQFLDSEERCRQSLGDRYQPKGIEQVKLLFDEDDDPEKVVKKISSGLEVSFLELKNLGYVGHYTRGNGGDVWEMYVVADSVKEKLEQIYSLLRALYDIEENKEHYFGKEKES